MAKTKLATTETPIHELIGHRWSTLAFSEQPVEPEKLRSILEAARWAPSSRNEQPWAYIVETRGRLEGLQNLLGTLAESNRVWAQKAPVLILTLAHMQWQRDGAFNRLGIHDLGQATSNLVTQATALGLSTHQIGGFDAEAARRIYDVPAGWEPISIIVLGYPGEADALPEKCRDREMAPRRRKPLNEFVFSGTWGSPAAILTASHEASDR